MKIAKYFFCFFAISLFISPTIYAQVVGQETTFERQLNTRDDQPLRDFVQSKESIDVKKKANNLDISGDVRFEWRSLHEKGVTLYGNPYSDESEESEYGESSYSFDHFHENYRAMRGGDHVDARGIPISTNDFDVEFNIKFRYTFKDAWAMAHLQFDNPAGIRGRNDCFGTFPVFDREGNEVVDTLPRDSRWAIKGSGEGLLFTLKRAYIGYNLWADGKHRLDLEMGRRKFDDIFDSEVQFTSRFDGVLLKFASAIEETFDWYWTTGVFIIDERVNHFGFATEIGVLNILDTGLDLKYSFIDWQKHGRNRCFIMNPLGAQFRNSQWTLTYIFTPDICGHEIPFEIYSGFLMNHAAKKTIITNWKRKNLAWYAGVYIGGVRKKGDWSFDVEYVGIQAQAVPEYDVGSIGRGNILDENILDMVDDRWPSLSSSGPGIPYSYLGYLPRRGNGNFTGWRFEFLYALTDNLSLDVVYEFSREEDRHIGGKHRYCDFELEAIYAF